MSYLENLTVNDIQQSPLPLNDILANSLNYEACEIGGGLVKDFDTLNRVLNINSFTDADYALVEGGLNQELNAFYGYTVFASRNILQSELIPNGWNITLPNGLTTQEYWVSSNLFKKPFRLKLFLC